MGSKGGGTQTSTTTSSLPPEVLKNYQDVVTQAKGVAATPYQQYQGQLVAPLNSTEQQATTAATNAQGTYQPYFNTAQGYINNGTQPITPSTVNASAINQYQSPYTQDVINSTMAQARQNDAIQQSTLAGNAAVQGAWGGDRSAVAQSLLAGQQDLANNQTVAGLENQGYSQALNEANTQQQTGMTAQQATAANALQASGLTGALGNYAQNNQLSDASALMAAGQIGQQTQQNQNTAGYQQFQQQLAYPFQNTQYLANIVEGLGNQGGTSSTTQPSQQANSVFGFLGLKDGGSVEGYDSGGGIPDFESSYVPNVQGGIGGGGSSIPNAPSAINNPQQPKATLNNLMNAGKGISDIYGMAKPYLNGIGTTASSLMNGSSLGESTAYGMNAAGYGNAAYDTLAASDAAAAAAPVAADAAVAAGTDAAAASAPEWMTALMAFLSTGGKVTGGYKRGGMIPHGYATDGSVSPPSFTWGDPNANGIGISGYGNNVPLSSSIDQMMGPQNFTPTPIDFSKGYVPASGGMSSPASVSSIPTAPSPINQQIAQNAVQAPPALSDLQAELSKTAPVLDKDTAIWQGVAGALAGKNRGILQNIGEGMQQGLGAYQAQKGAVADYALKEASAQKAAEQMAIEADKFNAQLKIEQENADTNKEYKDSIKDKSTYGTPVPGKGKDANGNSVDGVYMPNKRTGDMEFKPGIELTAKPTATGSLGTPDPDLAKLTGDDFITALAAKKGQTYANQIKSMADTGNVPSASSRSPAALAMLGDIYQYAPDSSTATKTAITRYDSGKQADQIRFNSTAMTHLDTVSQAADALANNDTQALNKMQNTFKTQFGSSAPTNFAAARDLATGEIVKAITQTGGTLEDRESAQKNIAQTSSPEQLKGVISTYQAMLGGQLYNQYLEYKSSTKQSDQKFIDKLDTSAKGQFKQIMAAHGNNSDDAAKTPSSPKYQKGTTATGPNGEKMIFDGTQWVKQ